MKQRLALLALLLVGQIAAIIAPLRALAALVNNPDQAFEIVKGYDLLGNPATNGKAGEYISQRAYRAQQEGRRWGCVLCRLLDYAEKDHCRKSAP